MNNLYKEKVTAIAKRVCDDFGIDINNLTFTTRFRDSVITPRQMIWCLCRDLYPVISLNDLGGFEMLGKKTHCNIVQGIRHIKNLIDTDKNLRNIYENIKEDFRPKLEDNNTIKARNKILLSKLNRLLLLDNETVTEDINQILRRYEKVN